jgi:hypothetical protein
MGVDDIVGEGGPRVTTGAGVGDSSDGVSRNAKYISILWRGSVWAGRLAIGRVVAWFGCGGDVAGCDSGWWHVVEDELHLHCGSSYVPCQCNWSLAECGRVPDAPQRLWLHVMMMFGYEATKSTLSSANDGALAHKDQMRAD